MMMQAVISGYGSRPATVYAILDGEGVLTIGKVREEAVTERFKDSLILSNTDVPGRDALFSEKDLSDGISRYFEMKGGGSLLFASGTEGATPPIEVDSIRDSGRIFRLSGDITSSQMAVIGLAWHVCRMRGFNDAIAMGEELRRLQMGHVLTI